MLVSASKNREFPAHLVFGGRRSGDGVSSALVVVVSHLHVEVDAA
jgi:hypothetical protein